MTERVEAIEARDYGAEEATRAEERAAWLERRRSSLGASEVAAVIGINPFATPLDVWASKKGLLPANDTEASDIGTLLEPGVLSIYERRRRVQLARVGTLYHPVETWASATPDSVVLDPLNAEPDAVRAVQAKVVGYRMSQHWGAEELGAEGVPDYVIVQTQWEMAVGGYAHDDVIALLGTEARIYEVARDDEMIALLMEECRAWWKRHVIGDLMPDGEGDTLKQVMRAKWPNVLRPLLPSTPAIEELARAYDYARAAEKAAAKQKEGIARLIEGAIADAEGFEGEWGKATWRTKKAHTRPAVNVAASRTIDVRLKASKGDEE